MSTLKPFPLGGKAARRRASDASPMGEIADTPPLSLPLRGVATFPPHAEERL